MAKLLDKELKYYIAHQAELAKKYSGKFAVIIGNSLLGVYNTRDEAVEETLKSHELGTFMVHQVGSGKENYTQIFRSRVGCLSNA